MQNLEQYSLLYDFMRFLSILALFDDCMGSGRLKVEFMNHHVNHHIKGQRTTPCFAVKDCKAVRNPLLPWLKKHATKATLHVTYDGCIVGECFTDILMNDKAT